MMTPEHRNCDSESTTWKSHYPPANVANECLLVYPLVKVITWELCLKHFIAFDYICRCWRCGGGDFYWDISSFVCGCSKFIQSLQLTTLQPQHNNITYNLMISLKMTILLFGEKYLWVYFLKLIFYYYHPKLKFSAITALYFGNLKARVTCGKRYS